MLYHGCPSSSQVPSRVIPHDLYNRGDVLASDEVVICFRPYVRDSGYCKFLCHRHATDDGGTVYCIVITAQRWGHVRWRNLNNEDHGIGENVKATMEESRAVFSSVSRYRQSSYRHNTDTNALQSRKAIPIN